MLTSKLELLLEGCASETDTTVIKTLEHLRSLNGVQSAVALEGALVVESTLPSATLTAEAERVSGRRVALQGFGDRESAVAMVSAYPCCAEDAVGVVRFQQAGDGALAVDGTLDSLAPGRHALAVHEAGDLSQGCQSLGGVYGGAGGAGELGVVVADATGRATFRMLHDSLKVAEIVGRSLKVSALLDRQANGDSPDAPIDWSTVKSAGCGVIARSAGVLTNPKRVCACDGVVVWDERDRPAAGRARREPAAPAPPAPARACCRAHAGKL